MKRIFALSVAALILVFATIPAFAAKTKNPSPTKPTEYTVIIHNPNGGTGTYTIEVDEDGQHATLVAHPKNGYEFVGWKIKGKYTILSGSLSDAELTVLLGSDIEAYPMFKKIGSKSVTSGSAISINSSPTSPQTSDNTAMYFIIGFVALFVIAAGAVGIKLAISKKQ